MAFLLQAVRECLMGFDSPKINTASEENIATKVLTALFNAEKEGKGLEKEVQDIVGDYGWTENIAVGVLRGLSNALSEGVQMGQAMKEAYGRAFNEAKDFAHDHPIFCTVLALGILAILMPWLLEALGFAELGPVEGGIDRLRPPIDADTTLLGTFAAWWQSKYAGYVPKKSLFSFFQRLGMIWRRSAIKAAL